MIRKLRSGMVAAAMLSGMLGACVDAWGANGDLSLEVRINNGMAYRDRTWAAVDVFVDNERSDVEGYVEVVLFSQSGDRQSPTYRVPAESPRNSTKRFRLHCLFSGCSRLEARLYHKGRPANEFPVTLQLAPIGPKDYLCLVLDDHPEDFGFLGTRLFADQEGVRFHRMSLDSGMLVALPDFLPCYTPFDLIVVGNIDPERIESAHRDLLRDYVRQGGTLVVTTGGDAARKRGSWIEDLCGVAISDTAVFEESRLAAAVFPEDTAKQAGVRPGREGYVAQLVPKASGVTGTGSGPILATLRRIEGGQTGMVAVDASSQILQECQGYSEIWRGLCNRKSSLLPLNFPGAAAACMNQAPYVAGVNLLPIQSVIAYLLTYFFVAIIGNWLFWNYMKRREMAWVCLIFFSAGFTGYAMFYGTQGRARESELAQFEMVRLPEPAEDPSIGEGEVLADLTSFIGVLAAGSGNFDAVVTRSGALIGDLASAQGQYFAPDPYSYRYRQNYGMMGSRPFAFMQSDPPQIQGLRIGASEMRFIEARGPLELPGGIAGQFQAEGNKVQGTMQNHTGMALDTVFLFYNGQFLPMRPEGETWRLGPADTRQTKPDVERQQQIYRRRAMDRTNRNQLSTLKNNIREALCTSEMTQYGEGGMNLGLKPCVFAWVNGPPLGAIEMARARKQPLYATLIAAPVSVAETAPTSEQTLSVFFYQRQTGITWAKRERLQDGDPNFEQTLMQSSGSIPRGSPPTPIRLHVPEWMMTQPCVLLVDLWLAVDNKFMGGPVMQQSRGRRVGQPAAPPLPAQAPPAQPPPPANETPFFDHIKNYVVISDMPAPVETKTLDTQSLKVLHLSYRIEDWAEKSQPDDDLKIDVLYQQAPRGAAEDKATAFPMIGECLVYASAHALPLGNGQEPATTQTTGD